jgi:putative transposase
MYIRRAVDCEGVVLGVLVQKRRHKSAALKLLRNLLKNSQVEPDRIVTDKLCSYGSAARELGFRHKHEPGGADSGIVRPPIPT